MGPCGSKALEVEQRDYGLCVIEIIRANHLPNMDLTSLTDAYVILRVTGTGGTEALHDVKLKTLPVMNCLDPVFYSYQAFPFIPEDTDQVTLDLFDLDITNGDDEIGSAAITFGEFKQKSGEVTLPIVMATDKRSSSGKPSVTIRLVSFGQLPASDMRKEIFVIRHGESKWNDSQADMNIKGMISQYDHELTANGIEQAMSLNDRWHEARRKEEQTAGADPDIDAFLAAPCIFSSPLTRAIQTSLVACEGHPSLSREGSRLTLLRNLREVKNFGSFDAVGRFVGQDIRSHVEAILRNDMGEERAEGVLQPEIDPYDCVCPWWNPLEGNEVRETVLARCIDLWAFLRYRTSTDKVILVGHSHFFRFMCQEFLSPEYEDRDPQWTARLATCKLDNGGCMRLSLRWCLCDDPMAPPVIDNAKLVFGSQLVDESIRKK